MIPFAVKQVWFWLALIGLIQCWITLIYFGRNVGGLWGRLYYCVFVTLIEGIFCIGMVWHMDPSRMPHVFCIAQVIAFSLGSFALTGLCASFALACARAVFRPGTVNTGRAVLAWHRRYIPLLVFFPCAACITHATLLVTLDAVQPLLSDDLHCDATNPIWMRLVGYSGVPLLVTVPFLGLSILTAYRLYQVRRVHSTRGTYTVDDGEVYEDDYRPTDMRPYGQNGPMRRSTLSLNAFLPYPSKAWFKKSGAMPPPLDSPLDKDPDNYPLHQHPFPAIDPMTGNPYSPSIEDRDAASFSIPASSLRMAQVHREPIRQIHYTKHPRNLSPHNRSVRDERSTPDSTVSSNMPVFATNPTLTPEKESTNDAMASGSSVRLAPANETGDPQVGLAITTGDSPTPRVSIEANYVTDDSAAVGLAVTTDEPERTPTPTPHIRMPSPLKNEAHESPAPSDVNAIQETLRPRDSYSRQEDSRSGLRERTRSYESITRTASSAPNPLHPNHSAPQVWSPVDHSSLLPQHNRQPSFVSSGTVYSAVFALPDREDRGLLPFSSPTSATTFQSPITPEDNGIDLARDRLTDRSSGDKDGDRDGDDEDTKNLEWEDDEYDHDMPMRTVKRRDPRERLGIYNPTPPTGPTTVVLEQRRNTLRKEMHLHRGAKLGSAIWRMVLFQIAFFTIQLLACLSSVLDLARHTITPFGTQHVALILAAWGPLVIFFTIPRFMKRKQ